MWKFYVYEVSRHGEVVYVGKGCGSRDVMSARSKGGSVRRVASFEHESAALDFERARIAERLADGCRLVNVTHGNSVCWWKRTDTKQMAREILEEMAGRVGRWIKAGKLAELSRITRMPEPQLIALHQDFGR